MLRHVVFYLPEKPPIFPYGSMPGSLNDMGISPQFPSAEKPIRPCKSAAVFQQRRSFSVDFQMGIHNAQPCLFPLRAGQEGFHVDRAVAHPRFQVQVRALCAL